MNILYESFCACLAAGRKGQSAVLPQERKALFELYKLGQQQGTLALMYPSANCFEEIYADIMKLALSENAKNLYRMLYYSRWLVEKLKEKDIAVVILKGVDLAGRYPLPEARSFGDIDLLLCDPTQKNRAVERLKELGCVEATRQDSNHHVEMSFRDIVIELHLHVVRAFELAAVNHKMDEIFRIRDNDIQLHNILSYRLPVLSNGKNACYLLLHMLQHFLTAGFGIRLLCDWCVFWENGISPETIMEYLRYCKELNLESFSQQITFVCVKYLDLDEKKVEQLLPVQNERDEALAEELMEDILTAGRFGETDQSRLLAPQRISMGGMFRSFHQQTRENYPNASRVTVSLPILWFATFVRFVRNNHSVRKKGLNEVWHTAKKRGKLTEKMRLWH